MSEKIKLKVSLPQKKDGKTYWHNLGIAQVELKDDGTAKGFIKLDTVPTNWGDGFLQLQTPYDKKENSKHETDDTSFEPPFD